MHNSTIPSLYKKYIFLIPPILAFFSYLNLLDANFALMDDPFLVLQLPHQSFNSIITATDPIWPLWYRPLSELTLWIDYLFWEKNPFGYHLTNIFIHMMNTVLVYVLATLLFEKKENAKVTAFFSSMIFAVHPIHVENLAWVSARPGIVTTLFTLSSFCCYIAFRREALREKKYIFLLFSNMLFFLALLSKESALPFVLVYVVYEYIGKGNQSKKLFRRELIPTLTLFGTLILFSFWKGQFSSSSGRGISGVLSLYYSHTIDPYFSNKDTIAAFFHSLMTLANFLSTLGFYAKKLFLPFPLNMVIEQINDNLYSFIGAGIFLSGLFFLKKRGISLFLLYSTFLCSIPVFPIAFGQFVWTHYSERYLYLSSAFFCIFIGLLIEEKMSQYKKSSQLILFSFFLLTVFFTVSVSQRSSVWADTELLLKDTLKKNPDSVWAHQSLGIYLYAKHREEEAIDYLKQAIAIEASGLPYFYLGLNRLRKGEVEEAEVFLNQGERYPIRMSYVYVTIGDIYIGLDEENGKSTIHRETAKRYYRKIENWIRKDPSFLYRLWKVFRETGDDENAKKVAQKMITGFPDSLYSHNINMRYSGLKTVPDKIE